ncbi:MAG: PhnA domain-containing protein [Bacteroidetes bacterium]|nr:PhnA domain-containing protein [Bacteroidota bacterium]
MTIEEQLVERSNNTCELCGATNNLAVYTVPPDNGPQADSCVYVCEKCMKQLEKKEELDPKHWACLRDSMWSEIPAVQVVAWRMLNRLKHESWAADAIDMLYLDDEKLEWAKAMGDHHEAEADDMHRDCNGALLQTGDSVTLIKSLDVKGSQINAKIGTVVKNIKIVADNTAQIEGKIEGQQIVILTKFVRKA